MEKTLSQQDLPQIQLVYIERQGHRGQRHIWLEAGRYLSSFVWTELRLSWRCCRCWNDRDAPKHWGKSHKERILTQQSRGGVATGGFDTHTEGRLHFFSLSLDLATPAFGNVTISGYREETMAACRVSSRVSPPLVSAIPPLRLMERQSSTFPCPHWK